MLHTQLPTASSQICRHFRTSVICLDYLSHTHNPELLTLGKSLFLSSLSIFVKVNSSLCLIKHQAMEIHGGRRAPHTFLTLASEKGECLTPHPDCTPRETAADTYSTGCCVVWDQVFDTLEKMKTYLAHLLLLAIKSQYVSHPAWSHVTVIWLIAYGIY
jgi:hypothetical protein